MIPKEAIEKAIEGGWQPRRSEKKAPLEYSSVEITRRGYVSFKKTKKHEAFYCSPCDVALDPSFWQSLGKALGWRRDHGLPSDIESKEWFEKADHFFFLHMHGSDTDAYWKELLK